MQPIATCGAAALLVESLFLPWQKECVAEASSLAQARCVSVNAWTTEVGVAVGVLALGVVVATLVWSRPGATVAAVAAGVALLVATLGFQLRDQTGDGFRLTFGYGSTVGFIAGGLLLALAVLHSRPATFDLRRIVFRLVPMLACAVYLVVVVVPWWDVLPVGLQGHLRFGPVSWVTISRALLALWLLREWSRGIARQAGGRLVILPVVLLGLAALDLIRLRAAGINWGGGAVVVLSLVLGLLGRVEQSGGLENLRVPEILRVDRL